MDFFRMFFTGSERPSLDGLDYASAEGFEDPINPEEPPENALEVWESQSQPRDKVLATRFMRLIGANFSDEEIADYRRIL